MRISDWSSDVCSSDLVAITGALGTVDEALVVPYADHVDIPIGLVGLLAASIPIGTLLGTVLIPTSGEHHRLLRGAAVCTILTAAAAVPLYWMEVGALGAFLACIRSEEHTSELQSLMRISYAVFCLKKKKEKP